MKNWLKKQATEFTAIMGFSIILMYFFAPDFFQLIAGVILIAIDDEKAKAWMVKLTPRLQSTIDKISD